MNIYRRVFRSISNNSIALIILFFFSLLIFVSGYELGKTSDKATERRKILVPVLLSLPFVVGLPMLTYIEKQIEAQTTKRLKQEKDKLTKIQLQALYDFMSFVEEGLTLDNVALEPLLQLRNKQDTAEDFINKLKENRIEFENSQEAIYVLLRTDKDEKGRERKLLRDIVTSALKETCEWKSKQEFKNKHRHLYTYLRAWLICGMRYNTHELPIESINENALSIQEQIKALMYLRKELPNHDILKHYLPNEKSRELIGKYLDNLIVKIRHKS